MSEGHDSTSNKTTRRCPGNCHRCLRMVAWPEPEGSDAAAGGSKTRSARGVDAIRRISSTRHDKVSADLGVGPVCGNRSTGLLAEVRHSGCGFQGLLDDDLGYPYG